MLLEVPACLNEAVLAPFEAVIERISTSIGRNRSHRLNQEVLKSACDPFLGASSAALGAWAVMDSLK